VHQARVATRRLRSDLKTFGAVLDPVWLTHTREDLKWVGATLGGLRDIDVLSQGLSDPPLAVSQRLAVQRMEAGRQLAEVLASKRYLNLVDRLHAGSEMLPLAAGCAFEARRPAAEVLPALVAAQWRALRRQVKRADPRPSPTQLHRIRIKAKRLRYAAEAASPIIGKPARRTASAAEHVQTVLGKHHDAVAAETWLRHEWAGGTESGGFPAASPVVALEVGRLIAGERRRQRRAERRWGDAWDKLRRKKSRRWISHH
jgi:CHAD domain-containing protein